MGRMPVDVLHRSQNHRNLLCGYPGTSVSSAQILAQRRGCPSSPSSSLSSKEEAGRCSDASSSSDPFLLCSSTQHSQDSFRSSSCELSLALPALKAPG